MDNLLNEYLRKSFKNKKIHKPLFYNFEYGIRFEIGNPKIDIKSMKYINTVYLRSILLFQEFFKADDDIYLVINDTRYDNQEFLNVENTLPIESYFYNKRVFNQNRIVEAFPYFYDENDLEIQSLRYSIKCKVKDIKFKNLLKAIGNYDLGIEPYVSNEVYFINIDQNIIYHLYDDRGLDIVASESRILKAVYNDYEEWILKYDKEKIDMIMRTHCP